MEVLLIRHGFLCPGDERHQKLGPEGPALHSYGMMQARRLGGLFLRGQYGDLWEDPEYGPVAVSEALCAQQTARYAGFAKQQTYSRLNETMPGGSEPAWQLTGAHRIPKAGLAAARAVLEQPPDEPIWFTHTLLMAAIYQELGLATPNPNRLTPDGCEVWPITI